MMTVKGSPGLNLFGVGSGKGSFVVRLVSAINPLGATFVVLVMVTSSSSVKGMALRLALGFDILETWKRRCINIHEY